MKKIVSFQLEEEEVNALKAEADKQCRNLSLQLRFMVTEYAKEHNIFGENDCACGGQLK